VAGGENKLPILFMALPEVIIGPGEYIYGFKV